MTEGQRRGSPRKFLVLAVENLYDQRGTLGKDEDMEIKDAKQKNILRLAMKLPLNKP
jgi:hypothetical protein